MPDVMSLKIEFNHIGIQTYISNRKTACMQDSIVNLCCKQENSDKP